MKNEEFKEDQGVPLSGMPDTQDELESQLLQSIERLDRGEGVNGQEVLRRLRRKIK